MGGSCADTVRWRNPGNELEEVLYYEDEIG